MPNDTPQDIVAVAEYTIDALAARTQVPSRTIRFYQSKGALPKPEIRGRKAIYHESHVERLSLIGTLQDRGLRVRAIRDLVQRIDSGELALDEWLGLEDQLHSSFGDDTAKLYTRDELDQLLAGHRAGIMNDLVRLDLLTRQGEAFLAPSTILVQTFLKMQTAGIDLDIAKQAAEITRKHMAKLSAALGKHYIKHAGVGFGRTTAPSDLGEAFGAARPLGQKLVHTIFGQEMEKVLRGYADSGQIAKIAAKPS